MSHPKNGWKPFIGYLRNEIRAQRVNQPQYAIHLTSEGVFLPESGHFPGLQRHTPHYATAGSQRHQLCEDESTERTVLEVFQHLRWGLVRIPA